MGVNGEALHAVNKKLHENSYQCYKSPENPYQVLQVPCTVFEHAMKSKVGMIVLSYTGKNYHLIFAVDIVLLHVLHTCNKLVHSS